MASSSPKLSLSPAATRKPQPIPWTHQETVNLISTYQEKWYSLKRGPLRGSQWEEVAVIVAARCGYHVNQSSKSALQCRHKMEKLRQRHRSEKHRLAAFGSSSSSSHSWQYFRLMDDLERGPQPISVRPFPHDDYNNNNNDDDEIEKGKNRNVKSKSINYILNQRSSTTREPEIDDDDEEEEEEKEEEGDVMFVSGLTAEIKGFADRIAGLENLKMEMMEERKRFRLEMEKKRIRMILESRWRILNSIGRAFGSS